MKATIWHNPRCGTSRKTLEMLRDRGVDVAVIDYLKTPPTAAELSRLYALAGISPRDGLRPTEAEAAALRETDDATILQAMEMNPVLIQRPLVETDRGVRLCRPPERVLEIL